MSSSFLNKETLLEPRKDSFGFFCSCIICIAKLKSDLDVFVIGNIKNTEDWK